MISVIVCTYNRGESLKKTLRSLAQQRRKSNIPWELIVVDNNSTDDTADVARGFSLCAGTRVRYVFEVEQGLSRARNAGINAANGDIIAFTDDDVTVDSSWLCELHEMFDRFDCAGVGGRIVPVWSSPKPSWLRLDGPHSLLHGAIVRFDRGEEIHEIAAAFGANMAFKKIMFQQHGLFRTDLGKCGKDGMVGEDTEFCMRLSRVGQKIVYAPRAIAYHPVPKAGLKSHFQSYYFNYGRCSMRLEGVPQDAALWFGVPRYMFRGLCTDIYRWLACFDRERFRHKLRVFESLGAVREARRVSPRRQTPAVAATRGEQRR